jgi:hypothetical protein
MSQRHLVAVGGTGQHVALAFVELGVLAEWFTPLPPTRLWLFDADASGPVGSGSAWDEGARQVAFLRRSTRKEDNVWADPLANHQRPYLETGEANTFAETVCPELGRLLFTEQQASVSFRNGYYGQPAVAATVFGAVLADPEQKRRFAELLAAPRDRDARIVVAGSAVGGTGSGCMPKLVESLGSAATNGGVDVSGRLMALLYLPWFRLEGGDDKATRRNEEMIARTASGLHYYKERLQRHSAAVVIGHPDVFGARNARSWQGDTQQSMHDDLSRPLYGACVAAQYFSTDRPKPFGLYAVPFPETGAMMSDATPVSPPGDSRTEWGLGRLLRANAELCHRLFWTAEYLDARAGGFPSRLAGDLDVPALRSSTQAWTKELRAWGEHKRIALARLSPTLASFSGESRPPSEFAALRLRKPSGGVGAIRDWLGEEPVTSPEDLARRLASRVRLGDDDSGVPLVSSVARLLPARVAGAPVQVQPRQAPVGTAASIDGAELDALIAHDRVAPRAIPNPRARELVLSAILNGRLRTVPDLRVAIEASTATNAPAAGEAGDLVRRWFLLLLGHAAGRLSFGAPLRSSRADAPINLAAVAGVAVAEAPLDGAVQVMWTRPDRSLVCAGYTSAETLFVPGALDEATWGAMFADIAPAERARLQDVVAAWVRLLSRAGRAAGRGAPGWLDRLNSEWADGRPSLAVFGLGQASLPVRWPTKAGAVDTISVRLPSAGGHADGTWSDFFAALGLGVVTECPAGDATAMAIRSLLLDEQRCPRFNYIRDDGEVDERIALWLYPGHSPQLHDTAARLIQERFYVSEIAGAVWDVRVGNLPVEVVRDTTVLLSEVGYLEQGTSRRYPDLPVVHHYLDLVDSARTRGGPTVTDATVSYRICLRGIGQEVERSVRAPEDLILPAGCLMWPNFSVPGWRQRYIWVDQQDRRNPLQCMVIGGTTTTGRIGGAVRVALTGQPLPVGFQLPERCAVPRALYLKRRDRNYGVFTLRMEELPRQGQEQWGVDFGTSASVVAACTDGVPWQNARLLRPSGSSDSTHKVLLGNPVSAGGLSWFPTWKGLGPREEESGLLPTRIVLREKVERPEEVVRRRETYGPEWMLDHGGPIDARVLESSTIVSDLKWGKQVREKRKAYLLRLLEQAAAWRARTQMVEGAPASIPAEVTIVFTLPLRMREDVAAFEEDVKEVLRVLLGLTGIQFRARFQWESIAGAIPTTTRLRENVYAMIDLGGGSLDFWGCYCDKQGRWVQRADSLLLGGSSLLAALSRGEAARLVDEALRSLTPEEAPATRLAEINGYSTKVSFFFDAVREVCARWLAALAEDAKSGGSTLTQFNVGLLGRAWFLGGRDWQASPRALELLRTRMTELGVDVRVTRHADVPEGQTDRKTYLARYVAGFYQDAPETLMGHSDDFSGYVGLDLSGTGGTLSTGTVPWHTALPVLCGENAQLLIRKVDTRQAPPLPTSLTSRAERVETTIQDRMNRRGGDQGGYRDPHGAGLTRSPFHHLIELVLTGWKEEA